MAAIFWFLIGSLVFTFVILPFLKWLFKPHLKDDMINFDKLKNKIRDAAIREKQKIQKKF